MIRMAVTDLDGTFLHTGGSYDRALAREVMAEAQAAGIQLVACTGKQCERVDELFEDVFDDLWIIGDSAARITHGGRQMWQHELGEELGQQIAQDLHRIDPELVVIVCVGSTAHVLDRTPQDLQDLVRMSYRTVETVESFEDVTGEIVKITAFDVSGRTAQARAILRRTYGEAMHVIDSDPQWLDVTAAGVDKGRSLAVLQQYLGIGPEQTLAFGDGRNDLALFDRAAFSMCVANGLEDVKEAAEFVIGANDEVAVLHTLAFGDGRNDLALFDRAAFSMCVANGLEDVKEAAEFVIGANDEDAVLHTLRRFARAQAHDLRAPEATASSDHDTSQETA